MNNKSPARFSLPLIMWLGYILFVVYGSLVPLLYTPIPLANAWAEFQNIPFLQLGVESRADWVANGVLYIPVAFLTAYLLTRAFQTIPRIFLFALAAAFSMALAVGVEFTQMFFPPRTVSLNDILAECIGSLVGLALSATVANWLDALLESFVTKSRRVVGLALDAYVLAYIAFAFFPYDFLLSWPELSAKIDSNNWGWFVANSSPRIILSGLQFAGEVVLTIPIGLWLARRSGSVRLNYMRAALIGLLLGGFIEIGQLFIASGVSQGLSVLTRALGVCGGLAISRNTSYWTLEHIAFTLRRYTPAIVIAYLIALLEINGWFTSHWQGLRVAAAQLAQVNFLPFYYHYYTSEAIALFSLGVVSISYIPIGMLAWARGRSPGFALAWSFICAVGIESGKLFIQGAHPDPTNILLACAASWLSVRFLRHLSLSKAMPVERKGSVPDSTHATQPIKMPQVWLTLCLAAAGVWALTFPAFPVLVSLVLVACTVMVWYRPVWVFAIIPAALPVFDLAPWSGRFFLDEFDALLLVGLAVAYSRVPAQPRSRSRVDVLFALTATLVALSFAISAMEALWPFALPDANSFNNYYSPYNALRIVKGAVWAFLTYRLSRRFVQRGVDVRRPFCWGMALGLGLTVAVILWERVTFSGFLNFSDGYRVTGLFSAMHTGGAYVECFLAAATPFVIALMLEKRHWLVRAAGIVLLLATTYALMVTFSRNGYLAFAVAVFVVLVAAMLRSKRLVRSGFIFTGLAGALLLVAVPIFKGEFAQSRMANVSADRAVRQAHWEDALNIRDPGWGTSLFGMGLGRFPETSYWRSAINPRSGTYRLEREAGNTYLRLGSGDSIYLEQLVSVEPGENYVLKLDVRPSRPDANVSVPICEKWMLTSYNCISPTFHLGKEVGAWRSIEARFSAKELSISRWYSQRPIKLSLASAAPNSTIDIDNVRLQTERGTILLRNGDFSQGLEHWFFSTDSHLQWHLKSLFYGVLFDQGWFGLVALGAFFILALCRAAKNSFRGDAIAGASLASLSSFLVVGLFDTLIDAPRFLLLVLLLAWACLYPVARSVGAVSNQAVT